MKIHSLVDPEILLAVLCQKTDIEGVRRDLSPSDECLQVACKKLNTSDTFRPHKHLTVHRETSQTQEVWIILGGAVEITLYDLNDEVIYRGRLESGDCFITLRGGHGFEVLEDDTILYEIKNGPYWGQESDKVFLNTQPS